MVCSQSHPITRWKIIVLQTARLHILKLLVPFDVPHHVTNMCPAF